MKRSRLFYVAATAGVAVALSACQQRQEDTPDAAPAAPAADVTVNPPPSVTVNPPDVNIKAPDVNVDAPAPPEKVTRESTTVDVPGVGSTTTTTTTEKK